MGDMYQVVGECAYATVDTSVGRSKVLLYKGANVPADTPELRHLIDSKLVMKVGSGEDAGVNALGGLGAAESVAGIAGGSVVSSTPIEMTPDPEVEVKRAEAKAKLPADGSAPDGRASEAVWVEYAVTQGFDRTEAEKAGKAALVDLLKKK